MLPANGQNQHWQPRHLFEPQFGGRFSLQLNALETQVDSEKDRLKQPNTQNLLGKEQGAMELLRMLI